MGRVFFFMVNPGRLAIIVAGLVPMFGVTFARWSVLDTLLTIWGEFAVAILYSTWRYGLLTPTPKGPHPDSPLPYAVFGTFFSIFAFWIYATMIVLTLAPSPDPEQRTPFHVPLLMVPLIAANPMIAAAPAIWLGWGFWRLARDKRAQVRFTVAEGFKLLGYCLLSHAGFGVAALMAQKAAAPAWVLAPLIAGKTVIDLMVFQSRDAAPIAKPLPEVLP